MSVFKHPRDIYSADQLGAYIDRHRGSVPGLLPESAQDANGNYEDEWLARGTFSRHVPEDGTFVFIEKGEFFTDIVITSEQVALDGLRVLSRHEIAPVTD